MRRPEPVPVAGRAVGDGHPAMVIAEGGVNHNGDLELARRMMDAAREAGADVIKFQTFRAERLVSPLAPRADYQRVTGEPSSQLEMLRKLELSERAHVELWRHGREVGLPVLSTPFDDRSADFLLRLGVSAYKVGSGELTNLPFLEHLAGKGLPMLVSTGMATLGEVEQAVHGIRRAGNPPLILLQCTSRYPAPPAEANLRVLETLRAAFGVPVGYSDHTRGNDVALAAVARGACVIEKHFTLDRRLPGPDHTASAEPDQFAALVRSIRTVEVALGHGRKEPSSREAEIAEVARRSVVAARDLEAGERITPDAIDIKRPGTGLPPSAVEQVVGRRLVRALPAGTPLTWEVLS
jgi:N,N'-diacetyllegionaminate synthase